MRDLLRCEWEGFGGTECRQNVAEPTTATARLGHVVRSSAEVVTHQVCAQGRGRDVSARGRATAGVGSETAGGGLANATARPPRCSAASIALTWQHRTPSYPAGAGGAAMSPQKSKWGATPYAAVAGPPAAAAVTPSALPRNCFASGGRRRTWAACGSQLGLSRGPKLLLWLNTGLGSLGWPGRAPTLSRISDGRPGCPTAAWTACIAVGAEDFPPKPLGVHGTCPHFSPGQRDVSGVPGARPRRRPASMAHKMGHRKRLPKTMRLQPQK